VYYKCVNFHKNPLSSLGGVAITRWIFMTLYTFVVHYLQMCMKECGCCPKFKRRDNTAKTFTKRGAVYLVSATPPKPLIGFL
jgi:hypothetical protein